MAIDLNKKTPLSDQLIRDGLSPAPAAAALGRRLRALNIEALSLIDALNALDIDAAAQVRGFAETTLDLRSTLYALTGTVHDASVRVARAKRIKWRNIK